MNLLVAYDGSDCSDAAIADLARSGLPAMGSAWVISVAEGWGRPDVAEPTSSPAVPELAESETLAKHARGGVQTLRPGWQVEAIAAYGSAAREILAQAENINADLIVLGAQGTAALGRFALGPVSLRVLTSASTSVRIVHDRVDADSTALRIAIAFDGSAGSFAAVDRVASARWPDGSRIRVISAAGRNAPSGVGRFVEPGRIVREVEPSEREWLEARAAQALAILKPLDLPVTFDVIAGNARTVVAEEAARWNADSIFLGAAGSARAPFTGSTAFAIASRATRSVEIVRAK